MTSSSQDRRAFLISAGAFTLGTATPVMAAVADNVAFEPAVAAIETRLGGRIGVVALDTASGARLAHRADERFAMASTFKFLLAAFVLARIDQGGITLDEPIPFGKADLLPHAPVTKAHQGEGKLPIETLLAAAVEVSDNGAANLLLKRFGGPSALTNFLRTIGDPTTRLDRIEMALNTNLPGDPRDTTTPSAMVATMQRILLGPVLTEPSRERLIVWLKNCQTGKDRLRAGLPKDWVIGDKTGSGFHGAINDLAIAWPPAPRAPALIACYMSGSTATVDRLSAAHAEIAALIGAGFG